GVLPMMQVKSRVFGNRMISMAFSNYGGPLAAREGALDHLYKQATELAGQAGCRSIEFRNIQPMPYDLKLRENKMCMHMPLDADPEKVWKGFDPKVRNQVRKAEKSGLVACNGRAELLKNFYRVYTVRMRQLGTPCYSHKIMGNILAAFPDDSRIFVVRLEGLTVGAAFTTSFNGFVEITWAATLIKYNKLCPNNLLYWSVIEHYCKAGARMFDFGRCTAESSTYRFKKQWGAEPVPLNYQYWVRPGCQLSEANPDNPKYKSKIEMWKKLPLWATRLIGPYISRGLP
ncbi:MAG: FemAB family PEP-CTERM system-associated protein, partial [Phycisphaerae bacterium]|nr:FemAB family PEP-CTERM system-associated protein [Phycisphaerae bacterium]